MDINEKLCYLVVCGKENYATYGEFLKIEDGFVTMMKFRKYEIYWLDLYRRWLSYYVLFESALSIPISEVKFIQSIKEGCVPRWTIRSLERAKETKKRYCRMCRRQDCGPVIRKFLRKFWKKNENHS